MYQFDKMTDVELSYDRVLEITIWEPLCNTNEFVGGIRLGSKPQAGNKVLGVNLANARQWCLIITSGWHSSQHFILVKRNV